MSRTSEKAPADALDEPAEERPAAVVGSAGRRRAVVGIGALLALLLVAAGSVRSYRDLSASRARISQLESEIEATQQRIDELGLRIEALETDPVAVEWLAREELGLTRPGEIVLALSEELR